MASNTVSEGLEDILLIDLVSGYGDYLRSEGKSANTIRSYVSDIEVLLRGRVSEVLKEFLDYTTLVDDIDKDVVEMVDMAGMPGGYSNSTVRRKINSISSFLMYVSLCSKKQFGRPIRVLTFESPSVIKSEIVPITPVQFDDLINGIPYFDDIVRGWQNERDRSIFTLMYVAGLTAEDVSGVKFEDFIRADSGIVEGIKVNGLVKSLCESVVKELKYYEKLYGKWHSGLTDAEPVDFELKKGIYFTNRLGGPIAARSLRRRFSLWMKRLSLPVSLTSKSLRYGYALELVRDGASVEVLARSLGMKYPGSYCGGNTFARANFLHKYLQEVLLG